ncbi:MAG: hypothetical protein ACPG44_05005 [Polaribacter sp.]
MRLFIYLFIYLFIACKHSTAPTKNIKEKTIEDSLVKIDVKEKLNKENIALYDTLLIEQVKFNNTSFSLKYSDLKIKKIDSLVNANWECGNPFGWKEETLKYVYIKGARYVTNEKNVYLSHVKFIKNNNLTIEKYDLVLNRKTSVNDFKKKFKNINVLEIDGGFAIYNIIFNPSQPEDNWLFYFNEKGYLIEFYLDWWLC